MDQEYGKKLIDERARVWDEMKKVKNDRPLDPTTGKRSAEDEQTLENLDADYRRLSAEIDEWFENVRRDKEASTAREAVEGLIGADEDASRSRKAAAMFVDYLRGNAAGNVTREVFEFDLKPTANLFHHIRNGMDAKEARAIYTDGGASAGSIVVPVEFQRSLYQYIEASSAIRRLARVITTDSGEPMTFPKVATHGVGTRVVAQGTAIGGTDAVFGTMRLDAYKYGELVKISTEAVADVGFDLLGFVAENIGRAVGRITDTQYVTGDGNGDPNGIITAASVGAYTGGSLIAVGGGAATAYTQNLDCLIDLQHSIVDEYRNSPNAAFVMADTTAGTIRKLRDGGAGTIGGYVWTNSTTIDSVSGLAQPSGLLGAPVYTDTNFGTNGSSVKPVAFGDWSAYYIRDSGNFRLERSDERYFDTDEVGFRGVLRTDADLIDTGAIKVLQQLPAS